MGLNEAALDRLRSIVGGEEDFAELLASFLEEAPRLVSEIVSSYSAGNLIDTQRSAHSLKSNAKDFGAEELATICAGIEKCIMQGRSPSPEDIAAIPPLLESAMSQLIPNL